MVRKGPPKNRVVEQYGGDPGADHTVEDGGIQGAEETSALYDQVVQYQPWQNQDCIRIAYEETKTYNTASHGQQC